MLLLLVYKIYLPVLSPIWEAIAKKIDFTKLNFKIMAYTIPNTNNPYGVKTHSNALEPKIVSTEQKALMTF